MVADQQRIHMWLQISREFTCGCRSAENLHVVADQQRIHMWLQISREFTCGCRSAKYFHYCLFHIALKKVVVWAHLFKTNDVIS